MIKDYRLVKIEDNVYRVHSNESIACPVCIGALNIIGSRKRKYIDDSGKKQTLIIRRFRCADCKRIHHELPDILVPYKRHCIETVEKIATGSLNSLPCEESTVRRIKNWWKKFRLYFENILISLKEKYGIFSVSPRLPKEVVRIAVNTNYWVHTRSAFLSS